MRIDFTRATKVQMSELFTRMYSPDTPLQSVKLNAMPKPAPKAEGLKHRTTVAANSKHTLLNLGKVAGAATAIPTPPESPHEMPHPSITGTLASELAASTPPAEITSQQLDAIAADFAAKIPEDTFTPAEIQGFLLTRKKEPVRAVGEVEQWVVETIKAKEWKKEANKSEQPGEAAKTV